jgi:hypothetical protein
MEGMSSRWGTRDWYLMHYSTHFVTGGQKHTHTHIPGTKEGETKEKFRAIAHGEYMYQDLCLLAGYVLALLENKWQDYFPQLPRLLRNMSLTFHYFGKVIATR